MKYFTPDWWQFNSIENEQISAEYEAYYASIRDKLPQQLVLFNENHTLHDASITRLECDDSTEKVTMLLRGWNSVFEERVNFALTFSGVSFFTKELKNCEDQLGAIGYIEFEIVRTSIELRILFGSHSEYKLVFKDFSFETKMELSQK